MLDLPKEATDEALLERLIPGCVIRTQVCFRDGASRFKRLIALTGSDLKTILATIVTTTPINAHNKRYREEDLRVKADQEKVFEKETYVQSNRVFELDITELQNNYNSHQLDVLGDVSDALLKEVVRKVSTSKLVERKHIQRILKENQRLLGD